MVGQEPQKHPARAELQRGAPGQHRRADHAVGAAEHADAAGLALVEVERSRRERLAQQIG